MQHQTSQQHIIFNQENIIETLKPQKRPTVELPIIKPLTEQIAPESQQDPPVSPIKPVSERPKKSRMKKSEIEKYKRIKSTHTIIEKLKSQIEVIKEEKDSMKLVDSKGKTKKGKCKLPLQVYEKQSLERIESLKKALEKLNKGSAEWTRINKQKLAQIARLAKRKQEIEQRDRCQDMQILAQGALNISLAMLPTDVH